MCGRNSLLELNLTLNLTYLAQIMKFCNLLLPYLLVLSPIVIACYIITPRLTFSCFRKLYLMYHGTLLLIIILIDSVWSQWCDLFYQLQTHVLQRSSGDSVL